MRRFYYLKAWHRLVLSGHPVVCGSHIKRTSSVKQKNYFNVSSHISWKTSLHFRGYFYKRTSTNCSVLPINFSSVGKGPFLTGKAKNMCQKRILLPRGGGGGSLRKRRARRNGCFRRLGWGEGSSRSRRLLFSSILSTNWPKSIFNASKQRIFTHEGCLCL